MTKGKSKATLYRFKDFVRRGRAAQKAVDKVLALHAKPKGADVVKLGPCRRCCRVHGGRPCSDDLVDRMQRATTKGKNLQGGEGVEVGRSSRTRARTA
jgi:hypothetical protein